jgi:hypothetical protein
MLAPHSSKDAGVVEDILTGIHNAMVNCFSLSTGAAYTGVLGVPTGKIAKDSKLASVEAMQSVLLYLPSVRLGGIVQTMSYSTAKLMTSE